MVVAPVTPSAPLRERLIPLLADGEFHSGEQLARGLGVSRTAVWKALNSIAELGIELHRVPKRGYRLAVSESSGSPQRLELLEAQKITGGLSSAHRTRLRNLEVHLHTDSTSSRLLEIQDLPAGMSDVCLAEHQTAGRGRRGRSWVAPFGASLCFSVSGLFAETPRQLSALSLAAGVSVCRAMKRLNIQGVQLKWPNDLLFERRKLGGILTELRAESGGPVYVVVGIGLNVHLTLAARQSIRSSLPEQSLDVASLREAAGANVPARNVIAAVVVDELLAMFTEFQREGFRSFAKEWRDADALAATAVRVLIGETVRKGIARGVDEEGALMLETPGQLLRFTSGEVSLRPSEA